MLNIYVCTRKHARHDRLSEQQAVKLYIIGNGFDISHEMPTQYSDFKKHLRSKDPAAADMLEEYLSCRDLWTDFERALGTIDARRILTTESEEYLPSRPGEIPDERDFSQVADAMSFKTQNLHERILKELKNWISNVAIPSHRIDYLIDTQDSLFFTFNYTKVLEKLYQIPDTRVMHIHGYTDSPIIGHGNTYHKSYFREEEAWWLTDEADDAARSFLKKTHKDVSEIISRHHKYFSGLSHIDSIEIIGHSMNDIDMPYYEVIRRSVREDAKWTIYWHSPDDKEAAEHLVSHLNLTCYEIRRWSVSY